VGDINTKVDRASMAHSLEVREPLMDHELVEWLATLPSSLKIQGQEGKYLFKKAMEPHCPTMCCTGRRWALRCRWRAGSAGR
jgi:asparagine synthase (glutamine-hydrolysing)